MRKPAETGDGGTLEHPSVTRRWCFPDCSIFSLACYLQMPIAETIWVSETQQCHRKVCIFKGTERWLQLIVIVWASLNFSQFLECKTEDHMKVQKLLCSFLPFSVWLSAIHNQEIQQPLYLKKNIHIYIDIFIFCILFLAAVVPGASESQLSASGVSYMEDLCKENFHELFGINKVFLKVP